MYLFSTRRAKPPNYAGVAVVSLMIVSGLTLAGIAVALTVMITVPVFVVLSPILVPVVITSSLLATGLLASGSLGASAIALLVWLYKKEEHAKYTPHAREVRPEKANNLRGGGKRGKPRKEAKPPERDKLADDYKPTSEKPIEESKLQGSDQSLGGEKLAEEANPLEWDKMAEQNKQRERDQSPEGDDKLMEEAKQLGGVRQTEDGTLISDISKVLSEEQVTVGHKSCGRSTSTKRFHQIRFAKDPTKLGSIFMKEYQKSNRVGASAYKYFTSRDKNYVNHIHII